METKLWYTQQANLFEEALPIGNGTLGAMVYGGTHTEKLSLNLDTLWSGKQQDYVSENAPAVYKQAQQLMLEGKVSEAEDLMVNKFNNMWSAYYLPMANLYIESDRADATGYRRELDLASAIATTRTADAVREAFVSFPHKCLVIRET